MSFNQRETLTIHIGQAGVQIGNATWQLYCLEHGIGLDEQFGDQGDYNAGFNSFFEETAHSQIIPRSIFFDTEPTFMNEDRFSSYDNFFNPDQLIIGKEDSAKDFLCGYHSIDTKKTIDVIVDRARQKIKRTNKMQEFMLCHSFGSSTGSGFPAKLLAILMEEYPHQAKFQFVAYPAPSISSTVVEPYNSVLTTHTTLSQINCEFMFDNNYAMYDFMRTKLVIERCPYTHLSRLMNQVMPFKRIHFPVAAYEPIWSIEKGAYESATIADLTVQMFQQDSLKKKCDFNKNMCTAKDINSVIIAVERNRKIQFVDWCPTGFKH